MADTAAIWRLVDGEANSMTSAVGKVFPITGLFDYAAGCMINSGNGIARTDGSNSGQIGFVDNIIDFALFVADGAVKKCAGHIAPIVIDRGKHIKQSHISRL